MPILTIILVLVLAGALLWAINTYIPMQGSIKNLLNIVVVLLLIFWLLRVFGLLAALKGAHV